MNPKIPIYVCCHAECQLPDNELLFPIQAGREGADYELEMPGDDRGFNISGRNANYCELTVLYWIWRNTRHKCFGLCHYRRYFNLFDEAVELRNLQNFTAESGHTTDIVNQLMQQYDIILPQAKVKNNGASLYQLYASAHHIKDMDLALAVIRDAYPQMFSAAQTALFSQPRAYYKNMMIAHRDFADAYCRWLFDVLRHLDCLIYPELAKRTSYQRRVYGFLAERLFNVFLEYYRRHNPLRIKEVPLLIYSEPATQEKMIWRSVSNI